MTISSHEAKVVFPTTSLTAFARDVRSGLSQHPKQLSSKYFYDAKGDKLFQAIMAMPEYYLTNCEYDIFCNHKAALLKAFGNQPFELIELGAGDGTKTKVLLEYFLAEKADFTYRPIDISGNVLAKLSADCAQSWPQLKVNAVEGDYFDALGQIAKEANDRRKVVFFLGGNIGNFTQAEAISFVRQLRDKLSSGDLLLIGFDLKKDPQRIQDAYDDAAGITAAFNLNLLTRINQELGGNFVLDKFKHWETYDPVSGEARSYLVSTEAQQVHIAALQQSFCFEAWEAIWTEVSAKYSTSEIAQLAQAAGMLVEDSFMDTKKDFVDSLWVV